MKKTVGVIVIVVALALGAFAGVQGGLYEDAPQAYNADPGRGGGGS